MSDKYLKQNNFPSSMSAEEKEEILNTAHYAFWKLREAIIELYKELKVELKNIKRTLKKVL